jgi:hypothetical protein
MAVSSPPGLRQRRSLFSFTPNSAAAERVFSLLKLFFGDTRMSALADLMQASLMLCYNKSNIGLA